MSKIVVIGGGASGLVTAIHLKSEKNNVILLEKNEKCGKKLLRTGNGHCNYYNENQELTHYHSNNKEKIKEIINPKTNEKVLNFFDELGIIPRIKNGYYYPYSNEAISIENTLVLVCQKKGVKIKTNTYVTDIKKMSDKWKVITKEEAITCDKVVISTGSTAGLKEEINTYQLVKKLGHSIIKPLPALTRLNLSETFLKKWSGIRNQGKITILVDSEEKKTETGEILYTSNGLSGICTMQLSRIAARALDQGQKVEVVINNVRDFCENRQDFIRWMDKRNKKLKNRNISELLDSIINYKLVNVLIKEANLKSTYHWEKLDHRAQNMLAKVFTELRVKVISTDPIAKAQTVSGGVPLEEINTKTMESNIAKNIYITGETLDIDGDCGGYNLTIAWTTGLLVGGKDD